MLNIFFLNLYNDKLVKITKDLEKLLAFKTYVGKRNVNNVELGNQIRWTEDEKMDAIVCEWSDYDRIMKHKPLIPVYPSTISSFDTCVILQLLKKDLEKKGLNYKKVILGTVLPINVSFSFLQDMFGYELISPAWGDDLSQEYFDAYAKEGYEVVVCGRQYTEKVRKSGMYPFYDEAVYEHVYFQEDIRKVVQQVAMGEQLQCALKDMKNMIDYAFEAICIFDSKGRITAYNEQARQMFQGKDEKDYVGKSFCEVVPAVTKGELQKILSGEETYYSRVVDVEEKIGMLNITPDYDKQHSNGAIVHFTTIQQIEKLETQVKNEFYSKGHYAKFRFTDILGESVVMVKAKKLAEKFSKYNSNVLLYGESGCGKELFAQSIHNASLRSSQPFVAVNCGALPANLLESELFGYVEGAFTGALKKGKKGLFEIAHKGTIFLDEISEMDIQSQVRLLRVLEERSVMRIGDDKIIPVNVRVIAASNKNLRKLVKEDKFREDLYYRLNVLALNIPPLRERGEDIIMIANNYLQRYGKQCHKWILLNKEAEHVIMQYPWEGNVRQLRNFCERLMIVAENKNISAKEVKEQLDIIEMSPLDNKPKEEMQEREKTDIKGVDSIADAEKISICNALRKSNGNREKAAELLGISKTTLWRKIKYYNIKENGGVG